MSAAQRPPVPALGMPQHLQFSTAQLCPAMGTTKLGAPMGLCPHPQRGADVQGRSCPLTAPAVLLPSGVMDKALCVNNLV